MPHPSDLEQPKPSPDRSTDPVSEIGSTEVGSPWAMAWPGGMFVLITILVATDMSADLLSGIGPAHLGIEMAALAICLAGVWGTGLQLRRSLARSHALARHLEGTLDDLDRARQETRALRAGLSAALDHQFERWALTAAQREVALLVLKGLSYKEIAELRCTAEHTVRNQALSIYRKAGLANRAEMAAFFIEDLLVPTPASRPGAFRSRQAPERGNGTDGRLA